MNLDVLLNLAFLSVVFTSFNLWMPRGNVDMFCFSHQLFT
jgi:hypothetical protein